MKISIVGKSGSYQRLVPGETGFNLIDQLQVDLVYRVLKCSTTSVVLYESKTRRGRGMFGTPE